MPHRVPRARGRWWLLPLVSLSCSFERHPPVQAADLVLRHAAVYTVNAARGWAEAVAVRDGRIVYVGPDSGAAAYVGQGTRILDLPGRMVLPGFHDNHVHLLDGGMELNQCDLLPLNTVAEVEARLRQCVRTQARAPWFRGTGWQLPVFPRANPTKELLDRIIPNQPAYVVAMDGHSAWVNSKALALAGITRGTRDPPNGRIERDPATGEPSGTLRESAMDLVAKELPPNTPDDYLAGLRRALPLANGFGIISLTEADADEQTLATYAELERRGELTARVVAAMQVDSGTSAAMISELVAQRKRYRGRLFRPISVKLFADGVLESGTAAVLEPYLDRAGSRGTLNYPPERLNPLVSALDREAFQIHVHAIGDAAIRETLNAFEFARMVNGSRDARHIIAHLELIDPADVPRFRALDVIASFQAFWAQPDEYITTLTEPAMGPARSRWLYPIESVWRTGAVVVGGSDWSVSSLNPLDAIEVGITRADTGSSDKPWLPEQRASLAEMLAAYTINGAWANREEKETGSIEVGKAADLVVLDRNLFTIPPAQIHRARVLLTLLEGREVYHP